MADRRLGSMVAIAVVVGLLTVIWWLDRGRDRSVHRIEAPAPVVTLPAIEASWIADPSERAVVEAVAAAIDRGTTDGAVYPDVEGHLPKEPPGYWRVYVVPGYDARRLVAGPHHEIYYSRDRGQSFAALRGALP